MNNSVLFLLQHSSTIDDSKVIGLYSSRNRVDNTIKKYKTLPGFQDYPDGFNVDEYKIDVDNWAEGFITV